MASSTIHTSPIHPGTQLATTAAAMPLIAALKTRQPSEILPWLPCTLALEIPVTGFTVASLLRLSPGTLVETACHQSADIPLQVNGVLMARTEFEVVGDRLAARITDLV